MKENTFNVSNVFLDESGRVVLNDQDLEKLESEHVHLVSSGGTDGGGYFPEYGINWFWCDGMTNSGEICTNGGDCSSSTNQSDCRNNDNCTGTTNAQYVCSNKKCR